jgi:hypothetical protein
LQPLVSGGVLGVAFAGLEAVANAVLPFQGYRPFPIWLVSNPIEQEENNTVAFTLLKTNSCTYFNTFIFTLKHQKIVKNVL